MLENEARSHQAVILQVGDDYRRVTPIRKASKLSLQAHIQKWQSAFSTDDRIPCWTIMERSTWHLLEARGSLTCPIGKADDDPMFQAAYAWMKASMLDAGITPLSTGLTPWWCWVRREAEHPEPYLEDLGDMVDPVVLQLSIPSHLVALSCFDLWHFVLNRSYVYTSEFDDQEFDRALELAPHGSEDALQLDDRLQQSWNAVFELDQCRVDMGPFGFKSIQGCFWTLERSYVTEVLEPSSLTSFDQE